MVRVEIREFAVLVLFLDSNLLAMDLCTLQLVDFSYRIPSLRVYILLPTKYEERVQFPSSLFPRPIVGSCKALLHVIVSCVSIVGNTCACLVLLQGRVYKMSQLVINHHSLYFSDGNIALLAPQSPDRYVAFRVHRSLLSKISPVFEGLFMTPHVDEESYEGVPLVYMADGADALESLFQLVYHDV
jgi:hypothetical protein